MSFRAGVSNAAVGLHTTERVKADDIRSLVPLPSRITVVHNGDTVGCLVASSINGRNFTFKRLVLSVIVITLTKFLRSENIGFLIHTTRLSGGSIV